MIDLARVHHQGFTVADIGAAQAAMGATFGVEWAPVRRFDPLPFWTPAAGTHEVIVDATYSRGAGPGTGWNWCRGTGSFFDPSRVPDGRHLGIWADDLVADAERLLAAGWTVQAANASPADGFGAIAYLAHPTARLIVELVSIALKPDLDAWIGD